MFEEEYEKIKSYMSRNGALPATWIGRAEINGVENHIIVLPGGRERHMTRYMLGEYIKSHQIFLTNSSFGFKANGALWLSIEEEQEKQKEKAQKAEIKHTKKEEIEKRTQKKQREKNELENLYEHSMKDHLGRKYESLRDFTDRYALNYPKICKIYNDVVYSQIKVTGRNQFTEDEIRTILKTPTLYNAFKSNIKMYCDHELNIFPTKTALFDYWNVPHICRKSITDNYFNSENSGQYYIDEEQIDGHFKRIIKPIDPEMLSNLIVGHRQNLDYSEAHYKTVIAFMKANVKDKSKLQRLGII